MSFPESLRSQYTVPLLLSFLIFSLYLFTLSPSINFGDSPELISAAYTLGISHPPGYPLYSLTGKLFSFLPFGESVAQRINLSSAFFSIAAIFMIALVFSYSDKDPFRMGLICTVLFLGLSPTLWSQSVIAEVYTLNLFLFALLLALSALWWQSGDKRHLMAAFFFYGLGLANHHTLVAFIPLLLMLMIIGKRCELIDLKVCFSLAVLVGMGLTVYIYLPLRSMQSPAMDWGDPQTIDRFLDVILRKQFPTTEGSLTFNAAWLHLLNYINIIIREFTAVALPLGLFGMIRSFRVGKGPFFFLFMLFAIHGVGTLFFLNPSPESYDEVNVMLLPSYAVFALWIGWGVRDIILFFSGVKWGRQMTLIIAVFLAGLLIYKGFFSFVESSQRNNYFALDYGANIFRTVEEKAVIFVESDTALFPLWYLQYVEGIRTDVAVIDVDFLMLPWFKSQIKDRYKNIDIKVEDLGKHSSGKRTGGKFSDMIDTYKAGQMEVIIEDILDKRPVYVSYEFGPVYKQNKGLKNAYILNHGLLYKISNKLEAPDQKRWDTFNLRSLLEYKSSNDPFVKVLSTAYLASLYRKAQVLSGEGKFEESNNVMKRMKEIRVEASSVR